MDANIDPLAYQYYVLAHGFLWDTCFPALVFVCCTIAIPKIIRAVFSGLD